MGGNGGMCKGKGNDTRPKERRMHLHTGQMFKLVVNGELVVHDKERGQKTIRHIPLCHTIVAVSPANHHDTMHHRTGLLILICPYPRRVCTQYTRCRPLCLIDFHPPQTFILKSRVLR
jgi:hypothetical protein